MLAETLRSWLAYARERLRPTVLVPLAVVLAMAASRGTGTSARTFGAQVGWALLLVVTLRLMDDLADREADRETAPQRVLVRAVSLRPFLALLACLVALSALAGFLLGGFRRLFGVWGIVGIAGVWYGDLRARIGSAVLRYHLLLLKYPALVVLLSLADGVATAPPWPLAWLCYLGLCVYEVAHDARLRALDLARALAYVEGLLFCSLAIVLVILERCL